MSGQHTNSSSSRVEEQAHKVQQHALEAATHRFGLYGIRQTPGSRGFSRVGACSATGNPLVFRLAVTVNRQAWTTASPSHTLNNICILTIGWPKVWLNDTVVLNLFTGHTAHCAANAAAKRLCRPVFNLSYPTQLRKGPTKQTRGRAGAQLIVCSAVVCVVTKFLHKVVEIVYFTR
jgi:hypothetical protein